MPSLIRSWFHLAAPIALLVVVTGCDEDSSLDCNSYLDESPSGSHVTVQLINQRAEPIFFSHWEGCSSWGDLAGVEAPDGSTAEPPTFGFSCEFWQDHDTMPAVGCEAVSLTAVAPGGTHQVDWAPVYYQTQEMPESCFAGEVRNPCIQARTATAGTYTFSAVAHTAAEGCDGMEDPCPCEGPAQDTCSASGMLLSPAGDLLNASATLDYPTATEVDIIFQ
ncbi:MAG: hypothetical protein DRI90_04165 [Deltaproteobacteria bacterium]|nr:MAG: hypothetical protein DRI90_04165 [Deltaproteobacteria bacterium]